MEHLFNKYSILMEHLFVTYTDIFQISAVIIITDFGKNSPNGQQVSTILVF